MARPIPLPENVKIRTTISLPARLAAAASAYRVAHPDENLNDFSAVIAEALTEYLKAHHPGLIEEAVAMLRKSPADFVQAEAWLCIKMDTHTHLLSGYVAEEEQAAYGTPPEPSSTVEKIIQRGAAKEAQAKPGALDRGPRGDSPGRATPKAQPKAKAPK
jgi:hypothetical protein